MCTNSNNSLLVTGDTQGYIKVWDIMSHCVKLQEDGVSLLLILISTFLKKKHYVIDASVYSRSGDGGYSQFFK